MSDARSLTDRELLLQVYDDVDEIKRDLLGKDGIARRLTVLEAKVDDRTSPRAKPFVIPAGVSALGIFLWEVAKRKVGME